MGQVALIVAASVSQEPDGRGRACSMRATAGVTSAWQRAAPSAGPWSRAGNPRVTKDHGLNNLTSTS